MNGDSSFGENDGREPMLKEAGNGVDFACWDSSGLNSGGIWEVYDAVCAEDGMRIMWKSREIMEISRKSFGGCHPRAGIVMSGLSESRLSREEKLSSYMPSLSAVYAPTLAFW